MARLLKLADRMKFLLPGLPSSGSRLMHCMPAEATVPLSSSFSPSFITDAAAAASAGEMLYSGAAGAAGFRSSFVGSMELMAVPKRKVTPSRKGKRNGPKFLKPVPVVAKCTVCGRVKLPQFYCCDGHVKA